MDDTAHFFVDYGKLNAETCKDSFPLPCIGGVLDFLSGSRFVLAIDLQSGYHQVAMDPNSKYKTAFTSHSGLYEVNVLSFGLTNSQPNFQRLINKVLRGLNWKIYLIYFDDIAMNCCFVFVFSLFYIVYRVNIPLMLSVKSHACVKFCSVSVTLPGNVLVSVKVSFVLM